MIGYDLDGVLHPDMTEECVKDAQLIDHAVTARCLYRPLLSVPKGSVIITGRPQSDLLETQLWVDEHFFEVSLILLGNSRPLTQGESAHAKASRCAELGVTLFIESDAKIASLMNDQFINEKVNCTAVTFGALVNSIIQSVHASLGIQRSIDDRSGACIRGAGVVVNPSEC